MTGDNDKKYDDDDDDDVQFFNPISCVTILLLFLFIIDIWIVISCDVDQVVELVS